MLGFALYHNLVMHSALYYWYCSNSNALFYWLKVTTPSSISNTMYDVTWHMLLTTVSFAYSFNENVSLNWSGRLLLSHLLYLSLLYDQTQFLS